jgi:hypothetical protein
MNGGRLRQLVDEMDDEPVADLGADERPGQSTIVRPGIDPMAWRNLHGCRARNKLDLDHVRVGIEVERVSEPELAIPTRRVKGLRRGVGNGGLSAERAERERTKSSASNRDPEVWVLDGH